MHDYILNGSQIIAEEWSGKIALYLYDAEGSPIGMQYRNISYAEGEFDTYWFEKNLQGDIIAVYSDTGTKLISYTYDAWGNSTVTYHNNGASTTATYNPFRYRGYYFDKETGFYYLNSRYYDPVIGRFINPDVYITTGQGLVSYNMFAYCLNDPVSNKDDQGTDTVEATLDEEATDPTPDEMFVGSGGSGAGGKAGKATSGNASGTPKGSSNAGGNSSSSGKAFKSTAAARRYAVKEAWKIEQTNTKNGTSTYKWTPEQKVELISTGKVSGFEGHHIQSVSGNPSLAGDPNNIYFCTRADHLYQHYGNWRTPTNSIRPTAKYN